MYHSPSKDQDLASINRVQGTPDHAVRVMTLKTRRLHKQSPMVRNGTEAGKIERFDDIHRLFSGAHHTHSHSRFSTPYILVYCEHRSLNFNWLRDSKATYSTDD